MDMALDLAAVEEDAALPGQDVDIAVKRAAIDAVARVRGLWCRLHEWRGDCYASEAGKGSEAIYGRNN